MIEKLKVSLFYTHCGNEDRFVNKFQTRANWDGAYYLKPFIDLVKRSTENNC